MITLITAPPGSGKSMFAVKLIMEARAKGRAVFSDVSGITVEGVQPAPDDWRDTPEGSLVVYDEAQTRFPSTGKPGRPDDARLQALETHRHTGHDLVFITQEPTFIHHHIRKLVGEHYHLHRAAGRKGAMVYKWDNHVALKPDDFHERKKADTFNFAFSKHLWENYKSATIHTHKVKIPKKLIFIGMVVLAILAGVVWKLSTNTLIGFADDPAAEAAEGEGGAERPAGPRPPSPSLSPSSPYAWTEVATIKPLAGCVSSSVGCACYDLDGLQLDLDEGMCRNIIDRPLPRKLDAYSSEGAAPAVSQPSDQSVVAVSSGPVGSGVPYGPHPFPDYQPPGYARSTD